MAKATKIQEALALVGFVALIAGMVVALMGGFFARDNGTVVLILVVLGIIIGILNITPREQMPFLVAAIALVVVGRAGFAPLDDVVKGLGASLDGIVGYIATLMVPAAVISALRAVWSLAQPGM